MGGRSYEIGNDCGQIWCKKSFGGIREMGPLPKKWKEFSLVRKENKSKGKKSQREAGDKKKDLLNVKLVHCHEYRHYAKNCSQKETSKK